MKEVQVDIHFFEQTTFFIVGKEKLSIKKIMSKVFFLGYK